MKSIENKIMNWIGDKVKDTKTNGIVIGLSGGIDSSVSAVLCRKILDKLKVFGIILPCYSNNNDLRDAELLTNKFDIQYIIYPLNDMYDSFKSHNPLSDNLTDANLKSRLRMAVLYYYANYYNSLVVGTTNKTEYEIGYYTKYGDGGVDIEPIADLYKTEIKKLAKYLKIPDKIINKAPSAGLWKGQTDEDELGITYSELDKQLKSKKYSKLVRDLINKSKHKRQMPPYCKLK